MSEYLSKEEIKQWRSSLEKITLEDFAARLGKKIEETKPTNDLIDIVFHGHPTVSSDDNWSTTRSERLSSIAERSFNREREISVTPFSASKLKLEVADNETKVEKQPKKKVEEKSETKKETKAKIVEKPKKATKRKTTKTVSKTKVEETVKKVTEKIKKEAKKSKKIEKVDALREEVRIIFKKALTDREQRVFDHFAEHKNQIVYAKDLANLLELPRDYVYKYIKNLRAKIEGENLQNADKGGFVLSI